MTQSTNGTIVPSLTGQSRYQSKHLLVSRKLPEVETEVRIMQSVNAESMTELYDIQSQPLVGCDHPAPPELNNNLIHRYLFPGAMCATLPQQPQTV